MVYSDGSVILKIPPGALKEDTDITLTLQAKYASAVAEVSDFSPNRLTFLKPATLTFMREAGRGKSFAIGLFDGYEFQPVKGSTYANGETDAPIMQLGKYSLVISDGRAVEDGGTDASADGS